jgi:hypothetical protein
VSKREAKYSIERMELPKTTRRERDPIYDNIIRDMLSKDKGNYRISIASKKPATLFAALSKRVKDHRDKLKLRTRGSKDKMQVFIERL